MKIIAAASNSSSSPPLLISFPQGVPLLCHDLELLLGERGKGRKRKRVIIGQSEDAIYRGADFTSKEEKRVNSVEDDGSGFSTTSLGFNGNSNSCHYAIGVVDDESNELRLMPASHVFVMRPSLRGANAPHAPLRLSSMSNVDRRESLTEEFGSKKKKKAVLAKLSNTILSENISGAKSIETVMSSLGGEFSGGGQIAGGLVIDAAKDALEIQRRELLPFFNLHAKTPAEVYPLDKLIPENIYTSLIKYYEMILAATLARDDDAGDFDFDLTESEVDLSSSIAAASAALNGGGEEEGGGGGGGERDSIKKDDDTAIISALNWVKILKSLRAGNIVLDLMSNLLSTLQKSIESVSTGSAKKETKSKNKKIHATSTTGNGLTPQLVKEHKRNVCRILFLHFTILYFTEIQSMPHHTVAKDNLIKAIRAPGDVTSYISQRYGHYKVFKGTPQYSHNKTDIDKLLMYLVILSLSNSKFSVNISVLANDLKLQPTKLGGLAKEVGCTVTKIVGSDRSETFTMAELKVPLSFPDGKRRGK